MRPVLTAKQRNATSTIHQPWKTAGCEPTRPRLAADTTIRALETAAWGQVNTAAACPTPRAGSVRRHEHVVVRGRGEAHAPVDGRAHRRSLKAQEGHAAREALLDDLPGDRRAVPAAEGPGRVPTHPMPPMPWER